jgi:nucleoid DNA-binding protein
MINKKDLAKRVSAKTLLSQKEALQVIDAFIDSVVESLEEEGEVSLVGFGKYYLYAHSPRPVRNPKTQEEMILKSYKSVKFRVSDKIKKHFKDLE